MLSAGQSRALPGGLPGGCAPRARPRACATPAGRRGGAAPHRDGRARSPETRGGRSSHIRSGSRSPSRASGRRARPPPVAERAQPLAMLRVPWPRGLNLAAAGSPAGPGGDGECRARRLGQGRVGRLPEARAGEGLPGNPASLLRAGGALRGAPDTPGLDFLTGGGGGVRWAATPTGLLVTDSVKTLQEK